jgi:MOSC domain-containing protein YiiM
MNNRSKILQVGEICWIGIRPAPHAPMTVLTEIECISDRGIVGDRYQKPGGHRQVTLIQEEHLPAIASIMRLPSVDPASLRRNLVVRQINLLALQDQVFEVGEVTLEGTGLCEPCEQMNHALGDGGRSAMTGHGGITARIIQGGKVRVGDSIRSQSL